MLNFFLDDDKVHLTYFSLILRQSVGLVPTAWLEWVAMRLQESLLLPLS